MMVFCQMSPVRFWKASHIIQTKHNTCNSTSLFSALSKGFADDVKGTVLSYNVTVSLASSLTVLSFKNWRITSASPLPGLPALSSNKFWP